MPVTGKVSWATIWVWGAAAAAAFFTWRLPANTTPLEASTVISSPVWSRLVAAVPRLLVPTMQGMPSSRETMEA